MDRVGVELDADDLTRGKARGLDARRFAEQDRDHQRVPRAPGVQAAPAQLEAMGGAPERQAQPDQPPLPIELCRGAAQERVHRVHRQLDCGRQPGHLDRLAGGQLGDRGRRDPAQLAGPGQLILPLEQSLGQPLDLARLDGMLLCICRPQALGDDHGPGGRYALTPE